LKRCGLSAFSQSPSSLLPYTAGKLEQWYDDEVEGIHKAKNWNAANDLSGVVPSVKRGDLALKNVTSVDVCAMSLQRIAFKLLLHIMHSELDGKDQYV
jgi:hypothetical protein